MDLKLTFDLLPVLAIVLSLAAWYIPKFNDWFATLLGEQKQLFMAGALFIIAYVISGLSALGLVQVYVFQAGLTWYIVYLWHPFVDFIIALIVNAGVYKATDKIMDKRAQNIALKKLPYAKDPYKGH